MYLFLKRYILLTHTKGGTDNLNRPVIIIVGRMILKLTLKGLEVSTQCSRRTNLEYSRSPVSRVIIKL